MKYSGLCLAGVISIFVACQQPETESGQTGAVMTSDTKEMARLLAGAYAGIDVQKATYLINRQRVEFFRKEMQVSDLQARVRAIYLYCQELLNAGNADRAVVEIEAFIASLQKLNTSPDLMRRVKKLLALAYLRLAEQENCIDQRNHESCILPMRGGGIYTMTAASEKAIQLSTGVLREDPDDHEARWLLNFAHMTLGTYPESVPQQWRVPESWFQSDYALREFVELSKSAGIGGTGLAGGCCVDDFNGDGLLDIIASSWGTSDPLTYYVNLGNGKFEDRSARMQLEGITGGLNIIHADYDNDGDLDFVVLRGAWLFDDGKIPNSLIRNEGDGTFTDVTISAGLLTYAPSQTAVWADFNRDGWVDLFIGTESSSRATYPCEFYLNRGDGTFENVIGSIGTDVEGFVKGCVSGDVNNDMWPDLYISYYSGPNKLLLNKGTNSEGVPRFEDIAPAAGVTEPLISFPTWFWDFNNDGYDDIFVSGYGSGELTVARDYVLNSTGRDVGGTPRLYINNGDLTFTDIAARAGIAASIYTMGCNFGDLDNDGFLDMYLGTGAPEFSSVVPNKMYRNDRGKRLQDVTSSGRFGHVQKGHGVGFGDFDNDGDEDIFQVVGGAYDGDIYENVLYRNPHEDLHAWAVFRLEGRQANRAALGARVKVTATTPEGQRTYYRTVTTGGSFGASSLQVELGLDNAMRIAQVEVRWPSPDARVQVFEDIPVNQYYRIVEGEDTMTPLRLPVFTLGAS